MKEQQVDRRLSQLAQLKTQVSTKTDSNYCEALARAAGQCGDGVLL